MMIFGHWSHGYWSLVILISYFEVIKMLQIVVLAHVLGMRASTLQNSDTLQTSQLNHAHLSECQIHLETLVGSYPGLALYTIN